jgi:hypothetical protein
MTCMIVASRGVYQAACVAGDAGAVVLVVGLTNPSQNVEEFTRAARKAIVHRT